MKPSFVVRTFLRVGQGERVTSLPAASYRDAVVVAGALRNDDTRNAEIGIIIPSRRGTSVYIPSHMFEQIQEAVAEALDDMTAPPKKNEYKDFED